MVERLWARLKEWRAIATRYEKTASSFMGVLCLAAAIDWIKPLQAVAGPTLPQVPRQFAGVIKDALRLAPRRAAQA